jgi:hypothetical protein
VAAGAARRALRTPGRALSGAGRWLAGGQAGGARPGGAGRRGGRGGSCGGGPGPGRGCLAGRPPPQQQHPPDSPPALGAGTRRGPGPPLAPSSWSSIRTRSSSSSSRAKAPASPQAAQALAGHQRQRLQRGGVGQQRGPQQQAAEPRAREPPPPPLSPASPRADALCLGRGRACRCAPAGARSGKTRAPAAALPHPLLHPPLRPERAPACLGLLPKAPTFPFLPPPPNTHIPVSPPPPWQTFKEQIMAIPEEVKEECQRHWAQHQRVRVACDNQRGTFMLQVGGPAAARLPLLGGCALHLGRGGAATEPPPFTPQAALPLAPPRPALPCCRTAASLWCWWTARTQSWSRQTSLRGAQVGGYRAGLPRGLP